MTNVPIFYAVCLFLVFIVMFILTIEDLEITSIKDFKWSQWILIGQTGSNTTLTKEELLAKLPKKKTNKWIVVTSVQEPTEDVQRLASNADWTLVVVGDLKTPSDCNLTDVHYLSVEIQEALGYDTVKHIPYKSYTRKNIGYLYAISNGAQWIYDTDDDNKPTGKGLDQFDYGWTVPGLRYGVVDRKNLTTMQDRLFNPYRHFGMDSMWPRGFPLEYIKDHFHRDGSYRSCKSQKTSAVQQGIVKKDPDVDAIFRLLHADPSSGLNERFNDFAPTVTLSAGTYSPWNSQNTLFSKNAFFGLFLPTTVAFRVTDIWRSYYTQALLHAIGETLSFVPANAVQLRNAHDYIKDFGEELDVYDKSGEIVRFLDSWTCTKENLEKCMIELAEEFAEREFWGKDDALLVIHWVNDLKKIKYEFPSLRRDARLDNQVGADNDVNRNCRRAHFHSCVDLPLNSSLPAVERARAKIRDYGELKEWCEADGPYGKANKWLFPAATHLATETVNDKTLTDTFQTVAVIMSGEPWKMGMGLLQRMYEASFGLLVFCGDYSVQKDESDWMGEKTDGMAGEDKRFPPLRKPIIYVHVSKDELKEGSRRYYCLAKIDELRLQNVKGFFIFSDKTITNLWHTLNLNITHAGKSVDGREKWWPSENGDKALDKIVELIKGKTGEAEVVKMIETCNKVLNTTNISIGGKTPKNIYDYLLIKERWVKADWVYIPAENMTFIRTFTQIAFEANIVHEIVMSKMIDILPNERHDDYQSLADDSWSSQYRDSSVALFPLNISPLTDLSKRTLFCDVVLSSFHQHLFLEKTPPTTTTTSTTITTSTTVTSTVSTTVTPTQTTVTPMKPPVPMSTVPVLATSKQA